MRYRFVVSLRIVAAVLVVAWAAWGSVAGQSPNAQTAGSTTPAKKFTPPKTTWGEPDLQGVWSYANLTPLERPSNQAGKEVLDDEEIAELDKEARSGAD